MPGSSLRLVARSAQRNDLAPGGAAILRAEACAFDAGIGAISMARATR